MYENHIFICSSTLNNSDTITNNWNSSTLNNPGTIINQCGATYSGNTPHGNPANNILCIVDSDKDGIPDNLDKCPREAETVNVYLDTDGCPDKVPSDSSSGTPQCQEGYYYDS